MSRKNEIKLSAFIIRKFKYLLHMKEFFGRVNVFYVASNYLMSSFFL